MPALATPSDLDTYDDRHRFTAEDVTRIILNDMVAHLDDDSYFRPTNRCQRAKAGGACARCHDCTRLRIVR